MTLSQLASEPTTDTSRTGRK